LLRGFYFSFPHTILGAMKQPQSPRNARVDLAGPVSDRAQPMRKSGEPPK
jgi:hypothetical protein